jgi:hypothetical protein
MGVFLEAAVSESQESVRDELAIVSLTASVLKTVPTEKPTAPDKEQKPKPPSVQDKIRESLKFGTFLTTKVSYEPVVETTQKIESYDQMGMNWWNVVDHVNSLDQMKEIVGDRPLSQRIHPRLWEVLRVRFNQMKRGQYLNGLNRRSGRDNAFVPGQYQARRAEDRFETSSHAKTKIAEFWVRFSDRPLSELGYTQADLLESKRSLAAEATGLKYKDYQRVLRLADWQIALDRLSKSGKIHAEKGGIIINMGVSLQDSNSGRVAVMV